MRTLVIAEAGVNHNGDLGLAKQLVAAAADAGADLVKFQTFVSANCISEDAPKADYQLKSTDGLESQFEMVRKLELSHADHLVLVEECRKFGIGFFSTAFDIESFRLLQDLELGLVKIPSGEITNLPLLRHFGRAGKPVILSTGMATLGEIETALDALETAGVDRADITLLHCTTEYPAPMSDVNLLAMLAMRTAFGVRVGYSDHTSGIEVAVAAVALGATVIEKHLTLDRSMHGPDHLASLEPVEFKQMVSSIRNIEAALGDGIKRPSASERKNRPIARKSLVASRPIDKGELLTAENVATKRPGTGISPMAWDEVIGTIAKRSFRTDELITL